MKRFTPLQKPAPGDRVAVLSPSLGLPELYPHIFELGLSRLKDLFGLEPVEYPSTRSMTASPAARAEDIERAFADTSIRAVIASIGGDYQVKVARLVDSRVLLANPKPFFGYSDNTHLINLLWSLGIPSYYGGMIMTQFAMGGAMHEYTIEYLRRALFDRGSVELKPSSFFSEEEASSWDSIEGMSRSRPDEPAPEWIWDGTARGSGRLWGGCLECLDVILKIGRNVPSAGDLEGAIMCLETSEEIPELQIVERFVLSLGERGLLEPLTGLLVGRPKAYFIGGKRPQPRERVAYRRRQAEIILSTFRAYNSSATAILNMDFGHTDPQIPLPIGGLVHLDPVERKIHADL